MQSSIMPVHTLHASSPCTSQVGPSSSIAVHTTITKHYKLMTNWSTVCMSIMESMRKQSLIINCELHDNLQLVSHAACRLGCNHSRHTFAWLGMDQPFDASQGDEMPIHYWFNILTSDMLIIACMHASQCMWPSQASCSYVRGYLSLSLVHRPSHS